MWFSGHVCPGEHFLADHPHFGLMAHPAAYGLAEIDRWARFAGDNGGYGGKFDPKVWLPFLDICALLPHKCAFMAVPDRFDPNDIPGNFAATQEMWEVWYREVLDRGLPPAWVAQNGATPDDIPVDARAVFIGGDDAWKTSERAWAIVAAAKARGKWAHMGRVNGAPKMRSGELSGLDSADGTLLKHGCNANRHRVLDWLEEVNGGVVAQPHLPIFGYVAL